MNLHHPQTSGGAARRARLLAFLAILVLLVAPGLATAAPGAPSTGDNVPVTIPGMDLPLAEEPAVLSPELLAEIAAQTPESSIWLRDFCEATGEVCTTGDFNGDGFDDVIRFVRSTVTGTGLGAVFVATSNGRQFTQQTQWNPVPFCIGQEECRVGDVNGDGMDDILAFTRGATGNVFVSTSNGYGFNPSLIWRSGFCVYDELCDTGDLNGDGMEDIVAFARSAGKVWVAPSSGLSFGTPSIWNPGFYFCGPGEVCTTGDFDGDGKFHDVIAFARNFGAVWIATSNGTALNRSTLWNQVVFCVGLEECRVGDFNGDRRDDIAAFLRSTQPEPKRGDVYVGLSTGTSFSNGQKWHDFFCILTETCAVGDANGDRAADLLSFSRGADGFVWVEPSRTPQPLPPTKWVLSLQLKRQ